MSGDLWVSRSDNTDPQAPHPNPAHVTLGWWTRQVVFEALDAGDLSDLYRSAVESGVPLRLSDFVEPPELKCRLESALERVAVTLRGVDVDAVSDRVDQAGLGGIEPSQLDWHLWDTIRRQHAYRRVYSPVCWAAKWGGAVDLF